MAIAVSCSVCGQGTAVGDAQAGKNVECPSCGKPIRVPTPPSRSSSKALWFVGIFLLIFGSIFGGVGAYLISKAAAAKGWPTVEGRVERSVVVEREDRDKDGTRIMYSADIVYSYSVNGTSYRCASISPGGMKSSSSWRGSAESDVLKYPAGGRAMIHYNPADPSEACLETSSGVGPWIFGLVGAVVLLAGLGMLGYKIKLLITG